MTRTLFYSCSHSDESHLAIDSVQLKQSATSHGMKAAEDSRTPKPCGQSDAQIQRHSVLGVRLSSAALN